MFLDEANSKSKGQEDEIIQPEEDIANQVIKEEEKNAGEDMEINHSVLIHPLKENIWFRGTIIPSVYKKNQKFTLLLSDTDQFVLMAIRNKAREWSIYSDQIGIKLVGKITCNLLGNFYKTYKSGTENSGPQIILPPNLDMETKYVRIFFIYFINFKKTY